MSAMNAEIIQGFILILSFVALFGLLEKPIKRRRELNRNLGVSFNRGRHFANRDLRSMGHRDVMQARTPRTDRA